MYIYHTAYEVIEKPHVDAGRKNADLGAGFYVSFSDAFAAKWARERKDRPSVVNIYEFDLTGLKVLRLHRDEIWLEYIRRNRSGSSDIYRGYYAVIAPVANDTIYDMFGLLTSTLIEEETALKLLRCGQSSTQMALKTVKAANRIRFISSYELDPQDLKFYREVLRKEEEAFQKEAADIFQEL